MNFFSDAFKRHLRASVELFISATVVCLFAILLTYLADWCRQHLAAIKVPRYVAIVESLPQTPTHRVAKYQMRQDRSLRERATDLGPSARPTR